MREAVSGLRVPRKADYLCPDGASPRTEPDPDNAGVGKWLLTCVGILTRVFLLDDVYGLPLTVDRFC